MNRTKNIWYNLFLSWFIRKPHALTWIDSKSSMALRAVWR